LEATDQCTHRAIYIDLRLRQLDENRRYGNLASRWCVTECAGGKCTRWRLLVHGECASSMSALADFSSTETRNENFPIADDSTGILGKLETVVSEPFASES
jgi:hypothetical protein